MQSKTHYVNLLVNTNPSNPYELEFRHNASGDTYGREADGLVAFNINNLPDTEGKTVKLKLKWKSFSGNKSTEFDFTTRKATPKSSAITAQKCFEHKVTSCYKQNSKKRVHHHKRSEKI